ncbi:MAG: tRNA lysidine(34) synthetase TilS [Bacteroidales bacterium]
MKEEFLKYISESGLFTTEDGTLLAVSGGIDSMVMTHLFNHLGNMKGIAHCNFQLRGNESDEDELFVKAVAKELGMPFYSVRFDTAGYSSEKGISIQMAARELRYRWFEEIRSDKGYRYVALAHNLNDNVETFLINLSRGTGIAGLTGMKPLHGSLLRPLLFASREEISRYQKENKIPYREDRSNSETKYTRNRIRHIILPQLREINPSFDITITETATRLNEIAELAAAHLVLIGEKVQRRDGKRVVFNIKQLLKLDSLRTVLFELFRVYGVSGPMVRDLVKLLKARSGAVLITDSHKLIKDRTELIILPVDSREDPGLVINNMAELKMHKKIFTANLKRKSKSFTIPASSDTACFDFGKIKFPLTIRKWKKGDYFYPFGMKGSKKLSDYFIDRKYSIDKKENCLIFESDGKIIWVGGDRIDNRFSISDETKEILTLKIVR